MLLCFMSLGTEYHIPEPFWEKLLKARVVCKNGDEDCQPCEFGNYALDCLLLIDHKVALAMFCCTFIHFISQVNKV